MKRRMARLIDAEKLPRQKQLEAMGNGEYTEVEIVRGEDIDNAPTIEVSVDAISREWLLNAFGLSEKTRKYGGDHRGYDTRMLYEIQDVIEAAPPIEPRHGTWKIERSHDGYATGIMECSNCGWLFSYVPALEEEWDCCPHCGARMEGAGDES